MFLKKNNYKLFKCFLETYFIINYYSVVNFIIFLHLYLL